MVIPQNGWFVSHNNGKSQLNGEFRGTRSAGKPHQYLHGGVHKWGIPNWMVYIGL